MIGESNAAAVTVEATAETVDNIDKFLRSLEGSSTNTKKQEKILEKLINSEALLEKYLKRSPECKEIFGYLDDTLEALNELTKSPVSLNINETNTEILFTCLEKTLVYYQKKHKSAQLNKKEENQTLLLVDKIDFKQRSANILTTLLSKYLKLITKCLLMKSSTKQALQLQETAVRLLTLCVQHGADFAKQIAVEYEFFNVYKNWLERFLLMKQTDLREFSIQFLISYFKYAKAAVTFEKKTATDEPRPPTPHQLDHDYLILLKKIFLSQSTTAATKPKGAKHAKPMPANLSTASSLIHCLFAHISTDSHEAIEFLLQELLFKFVQNDAFSKSEKIRLFSEKTLGQLVKLFEWRDHRTKKMNEAGKGAADDQTLVVREMAAEFLKVLFCSTKHGISFYDRTLNIDQSLKNYNHLIFNALINVQKPVNQDNDKKQMKEFNAKTNEMIDELLLKSLKVLINNFLKICLEN